MHPLFPHQVAITWEVTPLRFSNDGLVAAFCQKCESPLDISQPDGARPNRLLGTCNQCGAWHMVEVSPSGRDALLFNMPGVDFVRETLEEERKQSQHARRRPTRKPRAAAHSSTKGRVA